MSERVYFAKQSELKVKRLQQDKLQLIQEHHSELTALQEECHERNSSLNESEFLKLNAYIKKLESKTTPEKQINDLKHLLARGEVERKAILQKIKS